MASVAIGLFGRTTAAAQIYLLFPGENLPVSSLDPESSLYLKRSPGIHLELGLLILHGSYFDP